MERLTKRKGWHKDIDLKDELGYSYIYQRLSELENKIEDGELVSKDWHDEQVLKLQKENRRLGKRNSVLLFEKDAMEANCIGFQRELDSRKSIGDWVREVHKNAVQHGWYDGNSAKNFGELLIPTMALLNLEYNKTVERAARRVI